MDAGHSAQLIEVLTRIAVAMEGKKSRTQKKKESTTTTKSKSPLKTTSELPPEAITSVEETQTHQSQEL